MALWTLKRMDMKAVQKSKNETVMLIKKIIVIYVSVIGLAHDQQWWNIKKITMKSFQNIVFSPNLQHAPV